MFVVVDDNSDYDHVYDYDNNCKINHVNGDDNDNDEKIPIN